ncbi:MAG: magnesium/cobalt transporter CorA [Firmicutes bacterium]|nr:magnesium/cobalt transporter CorA [Bacillota bacterium]
MKINVKRFHPPGTLLYTGEHIRKTEVRQIIYNKDEYFSKSKIELADNYKEWIIINGVSDTEAIRQICEDNKIDALVIEDILNVNQRNKIEVNDDYIFAVLRSAFLEDNVIKHDYLSTLLIGNKVITFHEKETKLFDSLLFNLENNRGRVRSMNSDYLFYRIIDIVTDSNIAVQGELSGRIDELEEDIINLESSDQSKLYNARKELLYLKNCNTPIYESFVKGVLKSSKLTSPAIYKYMDDLFDHLARLNDDINTERELIRNLLDVYMNNISNRMNNIMKILTIFSATFIPLSFLAGVFGMNFDRMPLLRSDSGFMIFIGLCIAIIVFMLVYFKRKHWY